MSWVVSGETRGRTYIVCGFCLTLLPPKEQGRVFEREGLEQINYVARKYPDIIFAIPGEEKSGSGTGIHIHKTCGSKYRVDTPDGAAFLGMVESKAWIKKRKVLVNPPKRKPKNKRKGKRKPWRDNKRRDRRPNNNASSK